MLHVGRGLEAGLSATPVLADLEEDVLLEGTDVVGRPSADDRVELVRRSIMSTITVESSDEKEPEVDSEH